jgi:curli production assembly/transport component CsgG
MLRVLLSLLVASAVSVNLTGCYTLQAASKEVVETSKKYNGLHIQKIDHAEIQEFVFNKELRDLPPVVQKPTVAIYSFSDLTGQRKPSENLSSFSTAVTQAPEVFLIRALRGAGYGEVFQVVERKGLENLSKERQLIKSTRESYEGEGINKLPPLLFAGLIIEGGVVGYDTNTMTGGAGARYLGIGASKRYVKDTVTVSLRLVSVATGEVLIDVISTKTILSVGYSQDVFRFVEAGTALVEVENGTAQNESVNIATQKAIEEAVLQLIKDGKAKGYWQFN